MRISDWSSDVCSSDLLTQKGTWRIASLSEGLMGSYDLNGKTERLPRGTTTANLADRLPAGASNVRTAASNNRNEIFVTVGEPTTTLFKPTGKGIEDRKSKRLNPSN